MARMIYLGDDVTLPGTGYPPLAAFQVPYPANLKGAFFLGNGEKIGLRNWAGGADAVPVGSPAWGGNFATLSQDGYLQTDIDETLAMSLFVVTRETSSDPVGFIGTYGGGTTRGISLYAGSGATSMTASIGRVGGGGSVGVTSNTTSWGVYSLQVPSTGAATLKNHTTGNANNSAGTEDRVANGAGLIRLGRLYDSGFIGQSDMALALIYDRALSDAEAGVVAAFSRDYAVGRGIALNLA
ncbi:hypothetical protein [Paracoccus indicus]|uniref:hypothetical protein n=1 Tax=Paracoccus indicus TaxID=2079229 RepID=UPI000D3CAE43|nr:hypothetical protein [Paracoccus indicus]